ncbi:S-layer homology domain-containing protein [Paenibacillus sp.]|uniref:S-layer homology domain-containing protein n=1 Tax=Paenibacillus sp. TaxID=58172 RepID=UPI002D711F49|nr:S-layer homology domain-containing protein [Paenibacillus sp.]HZG87133.1 S-layer homology domain-containing protein [Paenibacillus sp.]
MSMWKKMLISALAFSIVAGGATSAFAAKPDWAGKPAWEKDNKKDKDDRDDDDKDDDDDIRGIHIEVNGRIVLLTFDDVESESAWALQYIAELVKRGVFTGYEDGTFRPNQKVTRIEAITAAVRQMGLRAQAESSAEMSTELNFKDADKIEKKYPWAVGYVAVAAENDLFLETETEVKPEQPADRLWATILLVKALGLENEAKAKMNASLTFKDKNEIPAGAVGYVAVALEKGLITGYDNNTFRPNKPVTRAELAAILDRTGDQLPDSDSGYAQVNGTFAGIVDGKVTITANGATKAYAVSQDVTVLRNNAWAKLSDLAVGDKVTAVVSNGLVIFLNVTQSATVTDGQKTGTVTAVGANTLTLSKDGQTTQYTVKSDAVILRNNATVALSAVKVGDEATVVVSGGQIVHVNVTKTATVTDGTKTGAVTAVGANTLTLVKDGQTTQYTVKSDAIIVRNGATVTLSAVKVGDQVSVVVAGGVVIHVNVTQPIAESGQVSGVVTAVYGSTIDLTVNNTVVSYPVEANATIVRNGAVVSLSAVQPGDGVSVVLASGKVLHLTVTSPVSDNNTGVYTVTGKYQGHRTENGKVVQISISTEQNNSVVTRVYNVSADAVVNGNALTLEKGVTNVELVVANQLVTIINIK